MRKFGAMKRLTLMCVAVTINAFNTFAYEYETRRQDNHFLHIVVINPREYKAEIAKANNAMFGREDVASIASRLDAEIAINAGFFEIKNSATSLPSGTLIVEESIYGLNCDSHHVLKVNEAGKLSIEKFKPKIMLELGREMLEIKNINGVVKKTYADKPVLYTSAFGSRTLTDYHSRREITFDRTGHMDKIFEHGNVSIPRGGFVVSFPRERQVQKLPKRSVQLHLHKPLNVPGGNSYVSGIPLLVDSYKIPKALENKTSSFFLNPHARTAVGIKPNGSVIIVVAEHNYSRDIGSVSLDEIKSLIYSRKEDLVAKYDKDIKDLSFAELKGIIKENFSSEEEVTGLNILQLAQLMQELGCKYALNLDGGGSSTLWLKDKIVNQTVGDDDESKGQSVLRSVSDAIVFRKR
jgi:exopolysaccharide biosynthesis protein